MPSLRGKQCFHLAQDLVQYLTICPHNFHTVFQLLSRCNAEQTESLVSLYSHIIVVRLSVASQWLCIVLLLSCSSRRHVKACSSWQSNLDPKEMKGSKLCQPPERGFFCAVLHVPVRDVLRHGIGGQRASAMCMRTLLAAGGDPGENEALQQPALQALLYWVLDRVSSRHANG